MKHSTGHFAPIKMVKLTSEKSDEFGAENVLLKSPPTKRGKHNRTTANFEVSEFDATAERQKIAQLIANIDTHKKHQIEAEIVECLKSNQIQIDVRLLTTKNRHTNAEIIIISSKVACPICDTIIQLTKGKNWSVSNFKRHILLVHCKQKNAYTRKHLLPSNTPENIESEEHLDTSTNIQATVLKK